MTRILTVSLVTLGDPGRLTGGYRYHRRMAELAPACDASLRFVSVPDRPFPLPALAGRAALRRARADVLALDSIAAAFLAPWLPRRRPGTPLVGSLHQPPGGIDHGPLRRGLQAPLDRLAYRRARLLVVASQALGDELAGQGFPAERIRVVPPGRDLPAAPAGPPVDLRQGRRAAVLCVANWVERKGLLELLEAVARLPDGLATLHLAGDDRADLATGPASGTGWPGPTWPGGWSSTVPARGAGGRPVPGGRRLRPAQPARALRDGVGRGHGRRAAGGRLAGRQPAPPGRARPRGAAGRAGRRGRPGRRPGPAGRRRGPAPGDGGGRRGGPPPDPPGRSRRRCSSPPSARPPDGQATGPA